MFPIDVVNAELVHSQSLLPPSCMVVPNGKIANITSYDLENPPNPYTNNTQENPNMNPNDSTKGCAVSREKSSLVSFIPNTVIIVKEMISCMYF